MQMWSINPEVGSPNFSSGWAGKKGHPRNGGDGRWHRPYGGDPSEPQEETPVQCTLFTSKSCHQWLQGYFVGPTQCFKSLSHPQKVFGISFSDAGFWLLSTPQQPCGLSWTGTVLFVAHRFLPVEKVLSLWKAFPSGHHFAHLTISPVCTSS